MLSSSKNVEARRWLDRQASASKKSRVGNIDMNSVQNKELTFHNTNFAYMEMGGQVWLTAAEVGQALEYSDDKAVQRIYSRHADEFTTQMTRVVKVTTPRGMQEARVFSLRGAHLVGMFARTPKAKEFRRWVLDILDREVAQGNVAPAFNFDVNAHNAEVAHEHMQYIYRAWCEKLKPSLRSIGSPLVVELEERIKTSAAIAFGVSRELNRAAGRKIH